VSTSSEHTTIIHYQWRYPRLKVSLHFCYYVSSQLTIEPFSVFVVVHSYSLNNLTSVSLLVVFTSYLDGS